MHAGTAQRYASSLAHDKHAGRRIVSAGAMHQIGCMIIDCNLVSSLLTNVQHISRLSPDMPGRTVL